jgi:DNA repair protein RecO (recombination protein O)
LLGYAPQLSSCASCGRPLEPFETAFSPAAGGFLCGACAEPGMTLVSVATLKVLRLMASGDIALYRRLKLEPAVLSEIEAVLTAQLEHHLDRRLKSLQFLRTLT